MQMQTASTARRKPAANSGQFTRTVVLTAEVKRALGEQLQLKRGQWVLDGHTGKRGQLIGTHKVRSKYLSLPLGGSKTVVEMREYQPGHSFKEYQKSY